MGRLLAGCSSGTGYPCRRRAITSMSHSQDPWSRSRRSCNNSQGGRNRNHGASDNSAPLGCTARKLPSAHPNRSRASREIYLRPASSHMLSLSDLCKRNRSDKSMGDSECSARTDMVCVYPHGDTAVEVPLAQQVPFPWYLPSGQEVNRLR